MTLNVNTYKNSFLRQLKNSEKTEHLTLREEAEMELIKESVKLDFENKMIVVET